MPKVDESCYNDFRNDPFISLRKIFFISLFVRGFSWLTSYESPVNIGSAIHKVRTDKKVLLLTFDDGPSQPYTDQILDTLKEFGVKATFFVIGKNAEKYPNIIRRIYSEGHEIGNHSWSHKILLFKSAIFILNEIKKTDNLLRKLGYKGNIYFRAPQGRKLIILPWILFRLKKKHILWNLTPRDWELPSEATIVHRVKKEIQAGSVILLHDGGGDCSNTVKAVPQVIQFLLDNDFKFLNISELLDYS